MANCNRRILFVCICLCCLQITRTGWLEKAFDFSTPILSTLDVGSDVYVCYNFWRTAQKEGEKPVFFTISFCLLSLSSLSGVIFFLFQNWSADDGEAVKREDSSKDKEEEEEAEEEKEDKEANEEEAAEGTQPDDKQSCLNTLQLSDRIGVLVRRCGCNGEKEFAMKMLMTSLLIVVLLPFGQLLPVLLWLQAKKKHEQAELLPPVYPADTQPQLRRLAFGERYTSAELQAYERMYVLWYYEKFLPYIDKYNKHFDRQLQRKILTHLPFVVETSVEAVPQSLLQTSAITILSQRDPEAIVIMNFVSIVLSLAPIFAKAYIACTSLVQDMFVYKMLLLCCDISSLFYAVSALWSLRRGDAGGVHVFFLTRPVDMASAIYVWCLFLFASLLLPFMLLRALGEWLALDVEFRYRGGEFYELSQSSLTQKFYKACRSQFLPDGRPQYDDENVNKEKRFTRLAMVVIFFITIIVFCLTIVPIVIFAQICKLFWIGLWLKDLEEQVEWFGWTAPYLLTVDEVVALGDCFDQNIPFVDYKHNALIADEHLNLSLSEIQANTGEKIRDSATFDKVGVNDERIIRLRNAKLGCKASGSCLRSSDVTAALLSDMGVVTEPGKASVDGTSVTEEGDLIWVEFGFRATNRKVVNSDDIKPTEDKNKTFFVQAHTWVMESSDFNLRVCAVNHALLTQHHSQILPEPLQPRDLRLGICHFWLELLLNMPNTIGRLTIPNFFYHTGGDLFEMFQSYDLSIHSIFVYVNSKYMGEHGIASKTWHSTKMISVIIVLGVFVQRALIATIMLVAAYMIFFPFLSFALALVGAVSRNQCSETAYMLGKLHNMTVSSPTWKDAFEKLLATLHIVGPTVSSLYREDCYPSDASPLNLFRTALFIVHLLLLCVVFAYWLWKARRLISFTVAIEKMNVECEPDELMQRVRDLYDQHYRVAPSSCSCCWGNPQNNPSYIQLRSPDEKQDPENAREAAAAEDVDAE